MRPLIPALAGFLTLAWGGAPAPLLWKILEMDSSGRVLSLDSLAYDSAGKLLREVALDGRGKILRVTEHHYDEEGRAHETQAISPEGDVLDQGVCVYEGSALRYWRRSDDESSAASLRMKRGRIGGAYYTDGNGMFDFDLDARGRARRIFSRAPAESPAEAEARIGYDSRGRHVSTRFATPDGRPIGWDTLILEPGGKPRELRRFGADGAPAFAAAWEYGPRGEKASIRERDGRGAFLRARRFVYLDPGSEALLARERSRWRGPARSRTCAMDGESMLSFGIEPLTLGGFALPRPAAALKRPAATDVDGIPDTRACRALPLERDSAECVETRAAAWADNYLDQMRLCRAHPEASCAARLRRDMTAFLAERPGVWAKIQVMDSLAAAILAIDKDDGYAALVRQARADTNWFPSDRTLLDRLLAYRVSKAYEAACRSHRAVAIPAFPRRPRPQDFALWPADFQEAWIYRHRILDEPEDRGGLDEGPEVPWTFPSFYAEVLDYLRTGKMGPMARKVRFGPGKQTRLILELESGDVLSALRNTEDAEDARRLMQCTGLDWESFLLGDALADGSFEDEQAFAVLARHGSPEVLRKILAAFPEDGRVPKMPAYAAVLGSFLAGPETDDSLFKAREGWEYRREPGAPPLAPELREQALERLAAMVDSSLFDIEAPLFARIFRRLDWPRKAEVLGKLAAYPDEEVQAEVKAALAEMGKPPGRMAPSGPVTFRFTMGGKPFPSGVFSYGLPCANDSACAALDGFGGPVLLDSNGTMPLERTAYAEARHRAGALRFHASPSGKIKAPVFDVAVPLPERPADTILVDIPLRRLAFEIVPPTGIAPTQEQALEVILSPLLSSPEDVLGASSYSAPLRSRFTLPSVGDGFYRLEFRLPGAAAVKVDRFEVHGGSIDTVFLSKGSDVRFRIPFSEDGEIARYTLSRRGAGVVDTGYVAEIESRRSGEAKLAAKCSGLSPGRYALRIESGRRASTKAFVIAQDSPEVVDLGEIRLRL